MGKHSKKAKVGTYRRASGVVVKAHRRTVHWSPAARTAVIAGAAGAVCVGTVLELGFKLVTLLVLLLVGIVTAFLGRNQEVLAPTRRGGKRKKSRGAFECRRCGGRYTNTFNHVCSVRWSTANKKTATRRSGSGKSSTRRAA